MNFLNRRAKLLSAILILAGISISAAVFSAQIDLDSHNSSQENSASTNYEINNQVADPAVGRVTSSNYVLEHYYNFGTTTILNHCTNSILDFDEVQIDCGGSTCQPCTFHCSNSVQDYDETGVDCGGIFCAACPPPGGGGGGGGGGALTITSVLLSGKAAPFASVKILKDGVLMATITADANSYFSYRATGLSSGTYRFSLYFDDNLNLRSAAHIIETSINSGQSISVTPILLPVTIGTDKSQVKKGDTIEIGGSTAPSAFVFITVTSLETGKSFNYPITAEPNGKYLFRFETGELEHGTYKAVAYAVSDSLRSRDSSVVEFKVGETTEDTLPGDKCQLKGDVNFDCRVNLVDFSITAYWFIREISHDFLAIEAEKLSNDGKITLTDFSILAYYWTG